jgi:hypothetical protein
MAIITLTKAVDGISAEEIVLRGASIDQVYWTKSSGTEFSVLVRFASGEPVLIHFGDRSSVAAVHAKIKAGMP